MCYHNAQINTICMLLVCCAVMYSQRVQWLKIIWVRAYEVNLFRSISPCVHICGISSQQKFHKLIYKDCDCYFGVISEVARCVITFASFATKFLVNFCISSRCCFEFASLISLLLHFPLRERRISHKKVPETQEIRKHRVYDLLGAVPFASWISKANAMWKVIFYASIF